MWCSTSTVQLILNSVSAHMPAANVVPFESTKVLYMKVSTFHSPNAPTVSQIVCGGSRQQVSRRDFVTSS